MRRNGRSNRSRSRGRVWELGCSLSTATSPNEKLPWRLRKNKYLEHLRTACADALLVSAADKLHNARASDLGLGYAEAPGPLDSWEVDWEILVDECPLAAEGTCSEFARESANYVGEIHKLVDAMFAGG